MIKKIILLLLICLPFISEAQHCVLPDVVKAFEDINSDPVTTEFRSNVKAPAGGHLQGIQRLRTNNTEQFIITGSSASYAYYILASSVDKTNLFKISNDPFRHAGGCQLAGSKLFTGSEDNAARDKSIIQSITPGDSVIETVIRRGGTLKRSTAGATGAVILNGQTLLAVGDWDSKNIDFYTSSGKGFDSIATFSIPETGTRGSYQSINLLRDTAGKLYMIGFCKEGKKNRADLFSITDYKLTALSSRYFTCTKKCSFRYGAGIDITPENKLMILACGRKLKKNNALNIFVP